MRLSTKGRYAVMAMVDLARYSDGQPVCLSEIAERQEISLSYLEQLFGKLRRARLVSSVRGPGGGYNLAQQAQSITVASIVSAVDEPLDATQCGGKENCHDDRRCMTHDLWATLNEKMHDYLSSVTLGDLVAHQSGKQVAVIKDFREKVAALPMAASGWKRIFLGNAMDVDIDAWSRVLIAPELRAAAGLLRDVMLLGMGSHFELWDAARYAEHEAKVMAEDMPEALKSFSF